MRIGYDKHDNFFHHTDGVALLPTARLDRLEATNNLNDLAAVRGNRPEALHGDRKGQFSIRINVSVVV
jgi:plasmid maintenance system killer protein